MIGAGGATSFRGVKDAPAWCRMAVPGRLGRDETAMTGHNKKKPLYGWRWVSMRMSVAFLIVFLTYNPTGYSYLHWLAQFDNSLLSLKVMVGILLFIFLQVLFSITFSIFRLSGMIAGVITAVLLSQHVLILVLAEKRMGSFDGYILWLGYLLPMTAAIVIGAGTSWAQIMTRLSGQEYKRLMSK